MAVSVHEVIFHQHFEQDLRTQFGNNFVKRVPVGLIVSNRHTFHKALNQHRIFGAFLNRRGKLYVLPSFEHLLEFVEITHFEGEIHLLAEGLLERGLAYGDFHGWREEGGQVAQEK